MLQDNFVYFFQRSSHFSGRPWGLSYIEAYLTHYEENVALSTPHCTKHQPSYPL
jgi:hypothetical protein